MLATIPVTEAVIDVHAQQSPVGDDQHGHVATHLVVIESGLCVHEVRANRLGTDRRSQD